MVGRLGQAELCPFLPTQMEEAGLGDSSWSALENSLPRAAPWMHHLLDPLCVHVLSCGSQITPWA